MKLDREIRWARAILFWKMGSCITRAVKELADKLFTISATVFKPGSNPAVFLSCFVNGIPKIQLYSILCSRLGESD